MQIKKLTGADAPEYQKLIVLGVETHPESFRISPADVRQSEPSFAAEDENDFTLGAFDDSQTLVGVVSFDRERREKMRHKGLIYRMYVADARAGSGIGRKLLRAAIERAAQIAGLEQINLTVVATNERARRLYESERFISFSHETRAIKIGANYYDEQNMVLKLAKH